MAFDYEKWISEVADTQDQYMLDREMLSKEPVEPEKPARARIYKQDMAEMLETFETVADSLKSALSFQPPRWLSAPELPPRLTEEWMWMHDAIFGDEDINGAFTEIAKSRNWWDNTDVCVTEAQAEALYRVDKYLKESK